MNQLQETSYRLRATSAFRNIAQLLVAGSL